MRAKAHTYSADADGKVYKDGKETVFNDLPKSVKEQLAPTLREAGVNEVIGKPTPTKEVTTLTKGVEVVTPSGATKTYDTLGKINTAGRVTGGVWAALDAINTAYEYKDDLSQVVTVIENIPNQVVDDAKQAADALLSGDYVELGDLAYQYTPVPVVTKFVDNIADAVGIELDTTGMVQDTVHDLIEDPIGTVQHGLDTVWKSTFGKWF